MFSQYVDMQSVFNNLISEQKNKAIMQEGGPKAKWGRSRKKNRDRQRDEQMSSQRQGVNKPRLHSAVTCSDPVTM